MAAAALGASNLKELAQHFRRVNPDTDFDPGRAYKWLSGKAMPRGSSVYRDLARLLDIGHDADWILAAEPQAYAAAVSARHGMDPAVLLSRGLAEAPSDPDAWICGCFAAYSHAQSPYYRGRIIRASLVIHAAPRREGLVATYAQVLATGRAEVSGPATLSGRSMTFEFRSPNVSGAMLYALAHRPTPPGSLLAGFLLAATAVHPDGQPPYATRIVMVRVPDEAEAVLDDTNRYLEAGEEGRLSQDLARFGLPVERAPDLDRLLLATMRGAPDSPAGSDQLPAADVAALVQACDRLWLR